MAAQGKYFLVEESQARLSADENVVELGFLLSFIQVPRKKRQSRDTLSIIRNLFKARAPSEPSPITKRQSISTSSQSRVKSLVKSSEKRTTSLRESRGPVQWPTCLLRVYAAEETSEAAKGKVSSDAWREVYQSDVNRVVNLIPVTLTAMLLLPIPPVILTEGQDARDRPIRFELWVGSAGAKKPDVLMGSYETSLGKLLKGIGSPKKFPTSGSCSSHWESLELLVPDDEKEWLHLPNEPCRVEVRIGFPERLISVAVPNNNKEKDATEWRVAPLFAGPTLRGLTFAPVSKGFQALLSESSALTTTMLEPKSKNQTKSNIPSLSTLVEFREEMAEMPLNLIIPACYLEQAYYNLENTSSEYSQSIKRELNRLKKVGRDDLALRAEDLLQKNVVESFAKCERMAAEFMSRVPERLQEMKEIATFYREQWSLIILGGLKQKKDPRLNKLTTGGDSTILRGISSSLGSSFGDNMVLGASQGSFSNTPEDGDMSSPSLPTISKGKSVELNVPSGLFDNTMISRHRYSTGYDLEAEDVEDINNEIQIKEAFEKQTGIKAKVIGEKGTTTFRPSTSRKDLRLRFMPINMHLQVLTVRETVVRQKIKAKISATQTKEHLGLRQRLKSVVSTTTNRLASSQSTGGSGLTGTRPIESKHSSTGGAGGGLMPGGGVTPPITEESDGPLLLNSRRKGRLSILQIQLEDPPSNPTVASTSSRNRLTSNPSHGNSSTFSVRPADIMEDDLNAVGGNDEMEQQRFFYDTLSAGAPSAHNLTSKNGGLWQMFRELEKAKEEARKARDDGKTDLPSKVDAFRKYKELQWNFGERSDIVLPQALSIIVGSILARFYVMAAEYSTFTASEMDETQQEDDVAQSIIKHGFLIGWESLLSTHGKELAMLGDLFYAVRYWTDHVSIRLETYVDHINRQTPTGSVEFSEDEEYPQQQSTTSAADRILEEALNVKLFKTGSKVPPKKDGVQERVWYDDASWIGPGNEDNGTMWLIVARLPASVVEKLPKVLRDYLDPPPPPPSSATPPIEGQQPVTPLPTNIFDLPTNTIIELDRLNTKPITFNCVLFTQGINEMQNLANVMGTRALQEEINEFSCSRLVEYCGKRFEVRPEKGMNSGNSSNNMKENRKTPTSSVTRDSSLGKEALLKDEDRKRRQEMAYRQSLVWAAKLKISVQNQQNTGKNFEILQNSADLVRWLSGIRIASCKSAKDRTAMSLTWEEARILHNVHFVRDMPLLELANVFREHGTRLINVHKNTGVPKYAFNKTQRSFLPDTYRPPLNTIGTLFGMGNVT